MKYLLVFIMFTSCGCAVSEKLTEADFDNTEEEYASVKTCYKDNLEKCFYGNKTIKRRKPSSTGNYK